MGFVLIGAACRGDSIPAPASGRQGARQCIGGGRHAGAAASQCGVVRCSPPQLCRNYRRNPRPKGPVCAEFAGAWLILGRAMLAACGIHRELYGWVATEPVQAMETLADQGCGEQALRRAQPSSNPAHQLWNTHVAICCRSSMKRRVQDILVHSWYSRSCRVSGLK